MKTDKDVIGKLILASRDYKLSHVKAYNDGSFLFTTVDNWDETVVSIRLSNDEMQLLFEFYKRWKLGGEK